MKNLPDKYYDVCRECRSRDGSPKQSYPSIREVIKTINNAPHKERKRLDYYPCPYGNGWHLTSRD